MTIASSIVTAAFREGNLVPVGGSPSTAEATEGLDSLNRLVLAAFGFTVGNQLRDWPVPALQNVGSVVRDYPLLPGAENSLVPTYNTYPPRNTRVIWDGSDQTIYFDPKPIDGAVMGVAKGSGADGAVAGTLTINGNGRTIDGSNTVTSDAIQLPLRWFYRADYADWRAVKAVLGTDDMLFPPELDDLWICSLSIRMAPRYGKAVAASTTARFGEMSVIFRTRYQQTAPTPSGGEEVFPAFESYSTARWMC